MPDRILPGHVQKRLSDALDSGAPLTAPLPTQARYAGIVTRAQPAARWRARGLTLAAAVAGMVAIAFAAPPQPRAWIVQSMGDIAHNVRVPAGAASPSPEDGQPPAANESPESHQSSAPAESPEPHESAAPGGGEQPEASPSGEQHDDGGGGDHSPEPSPSSGE